MVRKMNFDNYSCDNQMSLFDFTREPISITKPIRLIELFAGYGSQAMALKRIGAKFEHYRVVEFDKYAIASYITARYDCGISNLRSDGSLVVKQSGNAD